MKHSIACNHGALHELTIFLVVVVVCLMGMAAGNLYDPTPVADAELRVADAVSSSVIVVGKSRPDGTIAAFAPGAEMAHFDNSRIRFESKLLPAQAVTTCVYGAVVRPTAGCGSPTVATRIAGEGGPCSPIAMFNGCTSMLTDAYNGLCETRPVAIARHFPSNTCHILSATTARME